MQATASYPLVAGKYCLASLLPNFGDNSMSCPPLTQDWYRDLRTWTESRFCWCWGWVCFSCREINDQILNHRHMMYIHSHSHTQYTHTIKGHLHRLVCNVCGNGNMHFNLLVQLFLKRSNSFWWHNYCTCDGVPAFCIEQSWQHGHCCSPVASGRKASPLPTPVIDFSRRLLSYSIVSQRHN